MTDAEPGEALTDQQIALLRAADAAETVHEPAPIERLARDTGIGLDRAEQLVAGLDRDGYLQHGVTAARAAGEADAAGGAGAPAMVVAYRLTDPGRKIARGHAPR